MRRYIWLVIPYLVLALTADLSMVHAKPEGGPVHIPLAHGQRSATHQLGIEGARLVLQKRFSVLVPPGLSMIGREATTLKLVSQRATGREIAAGFAPIGPTALFDRAINASERPLLVEYKGGAMRSQPGRRFVLAVETRVFCANAREGARDFGNGICSGWELKDAVRLPDGLRARLKMAQGLRLQFGSVPRGE